MTPRFANNFVKVTGYIPQRIVFNTKIYYEDKAIQDRFIKGAAIIISNHTHLFDYAAYLFVFFSRTLRFLMAEVLYRKKPLSILLELLGGIYVNRNTKDFTFIAESEKILKDGGVVGIFPESRLPRPGEKRPLPFVQSAAFLALRTGVKVIPVYTNGSYFSIKRAAVIIGVPIEPSAFDDKNRTEKENAMALTAKMRECIIMLGEKLDEQSRKK